jgi:hypothetical protein
MPKPRRQPDSRLAKAAIDHIENRKLSNRNLLFNCRRFERIMGEVELDKIAEPHFLEFQGIGLNQGFTAESIRKTIISVKTVVTAVTGRSFVNEKRKAIRASEPELVRAADQYLSQYRLKSRIPARNCLRFCKTIGDISPKDIGTEEINRFRMSESSRELSPTTIEKTITDVMTICRHVTGVLPNPGRRLRRKRPKPNPAPVPTIEAIFPKCPLWVRQWLAVTFWTGLRLMDGLQFLKTVERREASFDEFLRISASKTGREHIYPVPEWFRGWLKPIPLPYESPNEWTGHLVRDALEHSCKAAGLPVIKPKHMRQRAVTQWMRANGAAGAIIHGKSLGVCDHYVDTESLLASAAPSVQVPACFLEYDADGKRESPAKHGNPVPLLQLQSVLETAGQMSDQQKQALRQQLFELLAKLI